MKSILAAAAALTLIATPVFAEEAAKADKPKADPEAMFKKVDANSDGFLTVEEFTANKPAEKTEKLKKVFERKDTDKDGKLSLDEMKAQGAKKDKAAKEKGGKKGKKGQGEAH